MNYGSGYKGFGGNSSSSVMAIDQLEAIENIPEAQHQAVEVAFTTIFE